MELCHLYISAGHNFFGHNDRPPGEHPAIEVSEIDCVAGHGIKGDRFFDYRDEYKGQVTFFALEVFHDLCRALGVSGHAPSALRRNVITRGVDLKSLIGQEFEVQGVRFQGTEECRPCYWMDKAVAAGAEAFLKGRGGLRARILCDGTLRVAAKKPVES